jgi:XapX domain-containing protein
MPFAVGIFVGLLYGVIKVKSPAPPIVALLELFGMVLGEHVGGWIHTRKMDVVHAASTPVTGKHRNPPWHNGRAGFHGASRSVRKCFDEDFLHHDRHGRSTSWE